LEGAIMKLKDEDILEAFKSLQEVIKSQKELNHIIVKRLKLLEASQFRQPLVLTKEMEVKN
jgi:F420-dependent methylenetetrahydromethanopterin dehydrogenase